VHALERQRAGLGRVVWHAVGVLHQIETRIEADEHGGSSCHASFQPKE
jgi:hypothetical protein